MESEMVFKLIHGKLYCFWTSKNKLCRDFSSIKTYFCLLERNLIINICVNKWLTWLLLEEKHFLELRKIYKT